MSLLPSKHLTHHFTTDGIWLEDPKSQRWSVFEKGKEPLRNWVYMVLMNALPETNNSPLKIGLLPRKKQKFRSFCCEFPGEGTSSPRGVFVGGFSVAPSGISLWQVVWVSLASDSPTRTLSWSHALKFLTRWWQLKYFFNVHPYLGN